jgi:hypothetical protein
LNWLLRGKPDRSPFRRSGHWGSAICSGRTARGSSPPHRRPPRFGSALSGHKRVADRHLAAPGYCLLTGLPHECVKNNPISHLAHTIAAMTNWRRSRERRSRQVKWLTPQISQLGRVTISYTYSGAEPSLEDRARTQPYDRAWQSAIKMWNYFKWAISSIALVLVLGIGGLIGLFACLVSNTCDDTIPMPVTNAWRYHRGTARGRCIGSTESTWRISAKSPPYRLRSIKPGRSISLLPRIHRMTH